MNEVKLDNDITVLGLFPTPVYTVPIPPELSVVCNYFDTVKQKEGDKVNEYGSHSENSYILHEPECKDMYKWAMTHIEKYADEVLK